jgi:hypothetical protein
MDVFSRLLDRWLAVGLALHTAIMGGLLGSVLFIMHG